jgi:hypothetical protein
MVRFIAVRILKVGEESIIAALANEICLQFSVADAIVGKAECFHALGKLESCEKMYSQAYFICCKAGRENSETTARILIGQADLLKLKGDFVSAKYLSHRSLNIRTKILNHETEEYESLRGNISLLIVLIDFLVHAFCTRCL